MNSDPALETSAGAPIGPRCAEATSGPEEIREDCEVTQLEAPTIATQSDSAKSTRFPLTDMKDIKAYLEKDDSPRVLVAFEFSGALRTALKMRGIDAVSVDRRTSLIGGPHLQCDVRMVVPLKHWEVMFFVGPNCYQILRADRDCLHAKKMDGRAYWGVAMVLWCLTRHNANAILVEQPDSIANDFLPWLKGKGYAIDEFRTSQYGDEEDKFMRITSCGLTFPRPPPMRAKRKRQERSQFKYKDEDERDRERSSWAKFPKMCTAIASAKVEANNTPSRPRYAEAVEWLAAEWKRAGLPLPTDYDNEDAQPTEQQEREYQLTRGRGRVPTRVEGAEGGTRPTRTWGGCKRADEQQGNPRSDMEVTATPTDEEPTSREQNGANAQKAADLGVERMLRAVAESAARVIVVPLRTVGKAIQVLLPTASTEVLTLPEGDVPSRSLMQTVEECTQRTVAAKDRPPAYRVVNTEDNRSVVAVVTRTCAAEGSEGTQTLIQAAGSGGKSMRLLKWFTLAALACGTPQTHWARLTVCSALRFATHNSGATAAAKFEAAAQEAMRVRPGKGPLMASARRMYESSGAITPRNLVSTANQGVADLKRRLLEDTGVLAEYMHEWSLSLKPMDLAEIPEELLDKPLAVMQAGVERQLMAERLPVYELPWLERMPAQEPLGPQCATYKPKSAYEMMKDHARRAVEDWFKKAEDDLRCLEEKGADCDRSDRPPLLALGKEDVHECAYGKIWDCRKGTECTLLDYHAPFDTDLNLDYLRKKLHGYPDQRLASNILEGVRLEADVEWQIVLHPNSASVGEGYDSVQKTVRELRDLGFYQFHRSLPYLPIIVTGQGARKKKLGLNKYRRTSNFSAPHKPTTDKHGRPVIAINDAARCYRIPEWMAESKQANLKAWDEGRYAHVKWTDRATRQASPRHKCPKEHKPRLIDLMRDLAVLLRAAIEMDQPLIVFLEDAAYYFNQLGLASEEKWKSNLLVGAREGDEDLLQFLFALGAPVLISEHRLGFGSVPSSNIAQRLSNAVTGWTMEEFDKLEDEARHANPDPAWEAWIATRAGLQDECKKQRPKRKGVAVTDCKQDRLATVFMYTDDPVFAVVGVERAARLLTAWHTVTGQMNLKMAGPEKRQAGAQAEWIGILIFAAIGVVAVARNKLLRARDTLQMCLEEKVTFGDYRALMGLLEHLRFVARIGADSTNSLYRPHGAEGESAEGPNAIVRPDAVMRQKLQAWIEVIMSCAGAAMDTVFQDSAIHDIRLAHMIFTASSDAAGDGRGTPGIGGYMHGAYWRIPLTALVLRALHITAWEALAAAVNAYVAARTAGPRALLSLQTDAALVPHAMSSNSSRSKDVQFILHLLQSDSNYARSVAKRMIVQHISGEANIMSDLVSRGLWEEFHRLCADLGIRPLEIALLPDEIEIIVKTVEQSDCQAAAELRAQIEAQRQPREATRRREKQRTRRNTRPLSPGERGTAKSFSSSTDGDGPFRLPGESTSATETPTTSTQSTPKWRPPHTEPLPAEAPSKQKICMHRHTTMGTTTPTNIRPLSDAAREHAHTLARQLAQDESEGRIRATEDQLRELALAVAQAKEDGANARTLKKDEKAWTDFKIYAELTGFDPRLRTEWTREFPERELVKLSGYMLFCAKHMKPRSKKDAMPKPMSIHHRYLALRRVFARQGQELPPQTAVHAVTKGLIRRYLAQQGVEALRPRRVEPITTDIVRAMVNAAQAGTSSILGIPWNLANKDCFNVTLWEVLNLQVGGRKGEYTALPGGNDWFRRSSVTYRIANKIITDPDVATLRGMTEGDIALLAPRAAKCDQWGTCHGTEPIILPFHDHNLNPARWLRDLETTYPCQGDERRITPLLARQDGQPYSDGRFADLVNATLKATLGPTRASMYSPHSWRVWLATALRASGASDARIQAFGRWLNPDSIKIYSRLTTQEYGLWMDKIMQVTTLDTARTTNLPVMDTADALRLLQDQLDDTQPTVLASRPARQPPHNGRNRQQCTHDTYDRHTATRAKRIKERDSRQRHAVDPKDLAGTTTGVGDTKHKFPASLDNYATYEERPSKRRPPTERVR